MCRESPAAEICKQAGGRQFNFSSGKNTEQVQLFAVSARLSARHGARLCSRTTLRLFRAARADERLASAVDFREMKASVHLQQKSIKMHKNIDF